MQEDTEHRCSPDTGQAWPWAMLLAAVPFVVGLLTLQLIAPAAAPHGEAELLALKQASRGRVFLQGTVTYAAAVSCHVVLCLGALAFYGWIVAHAKPATRRRVLVVGGVMTVVLLPAVLVFANEEVTAFRLTYYNYEDLFRDTPAGGYLLTQSAVGPTFLSLAANLPTAFGIVTVIAAAGAGHVLVVAMPTACEPGWKQRLHRTRDSMRVGFYLLSAVLVTSTLTASLFLHLPTRLLGEEPDGTLASYAGELSIYWGAIFTLTLVATIASPLVHARHRLAAIAEGVTDPDDEREARDWLSQEGLLESFGQQLRLILALLAPLITGPVANFLQSWQVG